MLEQMRAITVALEAASRGEAGAAAQLLPLVYEELRRLAAARLAVEKPGQTLEATALVHEAFLRLVGEQQFEHRGHFFAAAAEAMRRILVDSARRKRTEKHGGGMHRHDAADVPVAAPEPADDLIALDEALERLSGIDPVKAQLVQLRYFAGLTIEQAADALRISPATAKRYWTYSRAWLFLAISEIGTGSKG